METLPPGAAAGIPRLELENLTAGFRKKPVLAGVSLAINPGELVGLAGPNGSGKTTLLKTIGGILKPLAGRVLLDGGDTASLGKQEKARRISLLFQGTNPDWPFTVQEIIAQGRFPYRGIFGAELPRRSAGLLCELLEREGYNVARSTLERHLRLKGCRRSWKRKFSI